VTSAHFEHGSWWTTFLDGMGGCSVCRPLYRTGLRGANFGVPGQLIGILAAVERQNNVSLDVAALPLCTAA
jgi:hypothetical protein